MLSFFVLHLLGTQQSAIHSAISYFSNCPIANTTEIIRANASFLYTLGRNFAAP